MSRRHELTDEQWSRIAHLMPVRTGRGGAFRDHRVLMNGMFWKLCTGAPWRDLPERYGPWPTVYARFRRYERECLFGAILEILRLRLAKDGNLDYSTWLADGTSVRATRAAAGGKKGAAKPSATAGGASAPSSTSSVTARATRSTRS